MDPGVAHLETFFAALGFWFDRSNLVEVSADIGHFLLLKRLLRRLDGDADLKASVAGDGRDTDVAADVFDDATDDVETEAGAFADAFGGEKGIEDARQRFGGDAGAVVGNFDEDEIVFAGGADRELAIALHGVGGVVDEIGPDLIEFTAAGHDFGKIAGVFADDLDAALEFVIHDGKSRFEAALDVDLLHGALIHVGVFLDGFDEVGDAGRAVLELFGNAFHFEERGEAREFGAKRCARGGSKACEVGVGEACVGQGWRQLPGVSDLVRFEPGLDGLFALDAGELILELCGLQCGSDFLFAFGQKAAIFGADLCGAGGLAETGQAIAQGCSGTASGCGRIIELVSKTSGKFAQGGELLVLLFSAGDAANAVGEQTDEAADEFRQSFKEFWELADGKSEEMRGKNGATSNRDHFQTRERKHARDIAGGNHKYRSVDTPVFTPGTHLAFQHHHHVLRYVAFAHDDFTGGGAVLLTLGNKPEQFCARLVLENASLQKFSKKLF